MATLDSLIVKLVAETTPFETGMQRAARAVKAWQKEVNESSSISWERFMEAANPNRPISFEEVFGKPARDISIFASKEASAEIERAAMGARKLSTETQQVNRNWKGVLLEIKSMSTLLKGGGILAGVTLSANLIRRWASDAERAVDQFRNGEITAAGLGAELASSVPILGSLVSAGRSFHEILTGSASKARKIADEHKRAAEEAEKLTREHKQRVSELQVAITGGGEMSRVQERLEEVQATIAKMVGSGTREQIGGEGFGRLIEEESLLLNRRDQLREEMDAEFIRGQREQQEEIRRTAAVQKQADQEAMRRASEWANMIRLRIRLQGLFGGAIEKANSFLERIRQGAQEQQDRAARIRDRVREILLSDSQSRGPALSSLATRGSQAAYAIQARIAAGTAGSNDPTVRVEQAVKQALMEDKKHTRLLERINDRLEELGIPLKL